MMLCVGTTAIPAETIGGWPVATSAYDQAAITALDTAVESTRFKDINSVIVIRDGELLVERYYNGAARDETHNPRSVGKTFASAVAGIALAEGYLDSLDQQLGEFYDLESYDNYSVKKSRVTLRQLLTMTSGFDGFDFEADSVGNEENMYPTADWVAWTLNLPMASDRDPGDEWRYFTAGIVVVGDILNRIVPGGLENYAHEQLFAKLGITNYQWQHTPQRVASTAGGIQLTPLDFAKFGELYLRGGKWAGEQVIPKSWAADSFRASAETVVPGNQYGYLWWIRDYEVDGQTLTTVYCAGNGGNKIFVFEEQEIVIVVTASAYGRRYMHSQVDEMMTQYILPAVL
jgi:CubicO group peptidase (beta-lactamase class C family)